jgi:hypothetical protein
MAEHKIHGFLPATYDPPTDRQRLFLRYFTGVLIDLTLLGLFAEYWSDVKVSSFTVMLLAAILLQFLLKLTIWVEHHVAVFFTKRAGGFMKFMRYFGAWLVLFGSKFVILEALSFVFQGRVQFEGPFHGIIALIVVAITMVVVEELFVRLYRKIG